MDLQRELAVGMAKLAYDLAGSGRFVRLSSTSGSKHGVHLDLEGTRSSGELFGIDQLAEKT